MEHHKASLAERTVMSKKLAPLFVLPLLIACAAEVETEDITSVNADDHTIVEPVVEAPMEYFAVGELKNINYANQHYSFGYVEVLDVDGEPAAGVTVYGRFTGGLDYEFVAETDSDGLVTAKSPNFEAHLAIGLTIDSITYENTAGELMEAILEAENIAPQGCQHQNPIPTE